MSTGAEEIAFPIGGWVYNLAFFYWPPFMVTFFMSLPYAQTLEIIFFWVLTFLVIVPNINNKDLYSHLQRDYIKR